MPQRPEDLVELLPDARAVPRAEPRRRPADAELVLVHDLAGDFDAAHAGALAGVAPAGQPAARGRRPLRRRRPGRLPGAPAADDLLRRPLRVLRRARDPLYAVEDDARHARSCCCTAPSPTSPGSASSPPSLGLVETARGHLAWWRCRRSRCRCRTPGRSPSPRTPPGGSLIDSYPVYWGEMRIPGSVSAPCWSCALGEAGVDALGVAAHVPHYLAQATYPAASLTLLEHLAQLTGLHLPTEALRGGRRGQPHRDRRADRPVGGEHRGRRRTRAAVRLASPPPARAPTCWAPPARCPPATRSATRVRALPRRAGPPRPRHRLTPPPHRAPGGARPLRLPFGARRPAGGRSGLAIRCRKAPRGRSGLAIRYRKAPRA